MKAVKITAIIVAAILLFALVSFFFFKPLYYRIFYPWNRITGTIRVIIDGEKYDLKDNDVTGTHGDKEIGIGYRKSDDGTKVSIRGGDYGQYKLMINTDGTDRPLQVVIFQYNWWNVADFNLDISIDSAAKEITVKSSAQVLNEDGKKITEDRSTSLKFSDEELIHYIVSA